MKHSPDRFLAIPCLFIILLSLRAQGQKKYIHTKEGNPIFERKTMMANCLRALHKDQSDSLAVGICQCQLDQFERHFTYKQYKRHTTDGVVDIESMIEEDSLFNRSIQQCFTNSGRTVLLQAEGFEDQFMVSCKDAILKSTEKKPDPDRLTAFCSCQLELVKSHRLTDAEMQTLNNPNSLLFYQVMAECGDPFDKKEDNIRAWDEKSALDVAGPSDDTIRVLTLDGMTYVKIKLGSQVQVWLFDTGASDLLINSETEAVLKDEHIISDTNYLGTGEYEMANGMVDTCRKYRVNGLQIGRFTVNNMVVAVTDKGKKIIVGKALLNKFRNWMLDNSTNTLVLHK